MERIDFGLAENVIRRTETGKVPIPPNIQQSMLVQGVMDNFDHEENTASDKGGSHDTILMLFQNTNDNIVTTKEISSKNTNS